MSDTDYDWLWETCLDIQSNPQFLAVFAGPGLCGKKQAVCQVFASTGTREGELKAQGPQPAFMLGSVTEKASGSNQVAW